MSIPLAVIEDIIDASGTAEQIEALLPAGSAAASSASAPYWRACTSPWTTAGPRT